MVLQERQQLGSQTIVRQYTWGLDKGGGIGGLLSLRQNRRNYYYLYDGKGNVDSVIDSTQKVVASYRYDTFGRLMVKSGSLNQPYQFSTKRYLADVGLNYYGYRFYNPSIGRWMTRDPLGEVGGINLYNFVQNNSVNFHDPLGLIKPVPRNKSRVRNCDSDEFKTCSQMCGSKGVESCKVSQTWRVIEIRGDLTVWGWVDGPMSCSCNDPEFPNIPECSSGCQIIVVLAYVGTAIGWIVVNIITCGSIGG